MVRDLVQFKGGNDSKLLRFTQRMIYLFIYLFIQLEGLFVGGEIYYIILINYINQLN